MDARPLPDTQIAADKIRGTYHPGGQATRAPAFGRWRS